MTGLDTLIGARIPRLDAEQKLTGTAQYVDDLSRPNMLHAAILGSPYPHARIVACDASRARALAGVRAVVTGADLPDVRQGVGAWDEYVLARDKVRYTGEPVAAVAAEDLDTAKAALALIDIEYEELPAVFEADEALAEGAPILHENLADYVKTYDAPAKGNMLSYVELGTGDVERGWQESEVIVEGVYETPAIQHAYLEPCGALAEFDATGKLTIWSSTQSVFSVQAAVARTLGLPMSRVRCIAPRVGGGFGGKFVSPADVLAAALTLAARRPVKLVLSRDDDMTMMRSRHASRIRMKTGAKRDGTLVCREVEILLNGGAYADMSPLVLPCSVLLAPGPYRIPHVLSIGRVAYTNRLRASAMRGFGAIQPTFAGECQVDEIAQQLAMDPIDLRLKNVMRSGDKWLGSHEIPVCGLADCLEQIRAHPKWKAHRATAQGKRRGFGVAAVVQQSGIFASSASLRLAEDGSVTLSTGYVDIGNGSDTTLAQICAASLGIPIEQVNVVAADTDAAAYDFGTAADRGTHGVGYSVQQAAERVKEQLFEAAGEMLECSTADLELRPGGRVGVKGVPALELGFSDISLRGLYGGGGGPIIGTHSWYMEEPKLDPAKTRSVGFRLGGGVYYGFAAHAVEVEVDEATGQVSVVQGWCAHDVGRVINGNGVEGQITGGFVQGVGGALYEELVWDAGRLANPTLMDYKIPGAADVPYEIHCLLVENPEPHAPWGARGMADPCAIGPPPAIANAVAAATGVRVHKLPITAEAVLDGMLALDRSGQVATPGAAGAHDTHASEA